MKENFFIVSKDCLIVNGYSRSIVYDLTRQDYHYIPNSLSKIVQNNIVDFNAELQKISDELKPVFIENIQILDELDLLIWDSEHENLTCFQNIDFIYDTPNKITNLIFEESPQNLLSQSLISQLNSIDCQHIEIRCFNKDSLSLIPDFFENTRVLSVDIVTDLKTLNESEIDNFLNSDPRIRKLILFQSEKYKHIHFEKTGADIVFIPKKYNKDNSDCGTICTSLFSIDVLLVTESLNCNTCLNKKMSIGLNGEVKNCPSMPDVYGNINSNSLSQIANNNDFKKFWKIKKDDIQVCKDCEFRHMCTDCRAYRDSENIYSHPLKCNYNPYIAKWSDEEGYRTLSECGIISNENGFSIDHDKIAIINNELWEE